MDLRARLAASRPSAGPYARTLEAMPRDLAGATGRLAQLAVYPVKGLGALSVPAARIERHGLVEPTTGLADRAVMLAVLRPGSTPGGEAFDAVTLSNRTEGTLALTRASLEGATLVYTAPGLAPLRLEPSSLAPRSGERVRVKLYEGGPVLDGVRAEGALSSWVQALLRAHPAPRRFAPEDVVAVHPPMAHERRVAERHSAGEDVSTLYGDGAHALVASASTLAWMNEALRAAGDREIGMEAFRPNLVVDGLPPNAEDLVLEAEIDGAGGAARVFFATMCVRCDATSVDYGTGIRRGPQPLAWLARNRPPRDADANSATFAMNAVFPAQAWGGTLRVGDRVRVVRERA